MADVNQADGKEKEIVNMDEPYLEHAVKILTDKRTGYKPNRTFVDTISRFGHQTEYDLDQGFPLLTTKKLNTRAITHELIWMLNGNTNIQYLKDNNVGIWDAWADQDGELGPVYGKQWRSYEGVDHKTKEIVQVDQLKEVMEDIKEKPYSRRHIVSAWNPPQIKDMGLPPCHMMFQFNVQDNELSSHLYQRSGDHFIGVPFNVASYSMLTKWMAKFMGYEPGMFVHTMGDGHIYCGPGERGAWYGENLNELKKQVKRAYNSADKSNYLDVKQWIEEKAPSYDGKDRSDHVPKMLLQLSREPRDAPQMEVRGKSLEDLTAEDFRLKNYNPHKGIKADVAV